MTGMNSTKLYFRIALLRRQILLRQIIKRTIAGSLAVAALIVAAGLATYASFLALRIPLGDSIAAAIVAGVYLVLGLGLLLYTLHEPASPELDALAEMEGAALEALGADTQGLRSAISSGAHRIEDLGNAFSTSFAILTTLRRILSGTKQSTPG
uniref:Phage holin family protein n=1 Tax=Rhodopseudomonas palustris (strain BisA53) TaxID=316055 RepID=Q07JW8_RHOP5